jgi:hypothetical protein
MRLLRFYAGYVALTGASVAGDAAARDVQTRMHSLTYTAPASKAAYLGGRFLAAFALNASFCSHPRRPPACHVRCRGRSRYSGSFRAAAYLTSFFYIVLPNAFFATAIQFSLAALSAGPWEVIWGGMLLFAAAYIFGQALQDAGEWGNLVDPMSFTPVQSHLTNWSPLERNTRLVLLEGSLLANRLLWLSISLVMLRLPGSVFGWFYRNQP